MSISVILLAIACLGALVACIAPRIGRWVGWIVVGSSFVGSWYAYHALTRQGTADVAGAINVLLGAGAALVILAVGLALGFGLIAGASAVRRAVVHELEGEVIDAPPKS